MGVETRLLTVDHHNITEKHAVTRCPYCGEKRDEEHMEAFFGADHYHVFECQCGSTTTIRQQHGGTGRLERMLK
jgi:hypothetical protein